MYREWQPLCSQDMSRECMTCLERNQYFGRRRNPENHAETISRLCRPSVANVSICRRGFGESIGGYRSLSRGRWECTPLRPPLPTSTWQIPTLKAIIYTWLSFAGRSSTRWSEVEVERTGRKIVCGLRWKKKTFGGQFFDHWTWLVRYADEIAK